MPKQLQAMTAVWTDLEKRMDATLPDVYKIIAAFRQPDTGFWPRVVDMHDMLDERLAALGVQNAAQAADDAEVRQLLEKIAETKAVCRKLSAQYWAMHPKIKRILDDLDGLSKALAKTIKERSGFFSTSKSVDDLRALQRTVTATRATLYEFVTTNGPGKPDVPALN